MFKLPLGFYKIISNPLVCFKTSYFQVSINLMFGTNIKNPLYYYIFFAVFSYNNPLQTDKAVNVFPLPKTNKYYLLLFIFTSSKILIFILI